MTAGIRASQKEALSERRAAGRRYPEPGIVISSTGSPQFESVMLSTTPFTRERELPLPTTAIKLAVLGKPIHFTVSGIFWEPGLSL